MTLIFSRTDDDSIILSDFKAHHCGWYSILSDARGDSLNDFSDTSNFCPLNLDTPTRLPGNGAPSSPDVTLISAHLLPSVSWSTATRLNSDHLPISVSFLEEAFYYQKNFHQFWASELGSV
jgi:hypothetical protein